MRTFKNLYYEHKSKKIVVWELVDGKEERNIYKFIPFFYVKDGKEPTVKDIYGTPMKKVMDETGELIKTYKLAGSQMAEGDVEIETKFLQEHYSNEDLKYNISDFNVAFIDIEVASGNGGFLPNQRIRVKKTEDSNEEGLTIKELEDIPDHNNYLVYDDGWKFFINSRYSSTEFPKPTEAKYPVNLISVSSSKTGRVATFGLEPYTGNSAEVQDYYCCRDEQDLLYNFTAWFKNQKIDILTGWNIDNFDIPYLYNRCANLGLLEAFKRMSPVNKVRVKKDENERVSEVYIYALTVLDYIELYKKFTYHTEESYSLQYIGTKIVGEGKTEYDGSINTIYKTDWNRFVEYNVQDVRLVEKIDHKIKFIELAITFAYNALVPIDRVFSQIATIEGYIMKYLHKNGMVMPNRNEGVRDWWVEEGMFETSPDHWQNFDIGTKNKYENVAEFKIKGAHVDSNPGFYTNSLCFDVASLYPHMIMQYNISPETKVIKPTSTDGLIESEINGVYYKRDVSGVIPTVVKAIFDERKKFKKEMFKHDPHTEEYKFYNTQQQVRKILINSIYGAMANKYFHFYDVDNARAITRGGRVLIKYLSTNLVDFLTNVFAKHPEKLFPEAKPFTFKRTPHTLTDTDSIHVCLEEVKSNCCPDMDSYKFLHEIMEPYLENFFDKILTIKANKKGMKQVIDFKREGIIIKEFVLAKKKYLSLLVQNEDTIYDPPYLKPTGVEIKRSDTPQFCKERITEAVNDIITNLDKERNLDLIRDAFKDFKNQDIDSIANVGSVSEYTKYATPEIEKTLIFRCGTPMRNKAAILYNHMVNEMKLPLSKIDNGSKIKYIHIVPDFRYKEANVIAWIGNFPEEFKGLFKIDYEKQFETFLNVLERMHAVIGWCGEEGISLKKTKMSSFIS